MMHYNYYYLKMQELQEKFILDYSNQLIYLLILFFKYDNFIQFYLIRILYLDIL
mgnify:CR=1 FL=1